MKIFISFGTVLLAAGAVFARSPQAVAAMPAVSAEPVVSVVPQTVSPVVPLPQIVVGSAAVDSVPQLTIVPVQQAPEHIVEHTTVYETPAGHMTRAERRAYRAKAYAARIDSLVQSRDYLFYPNSMQEISGGTIRSIYADYCFFGLLVDRVEVHLPAEQGIAQNVWMLDFDSTSIADYRASRMPWGWRVSFDFADGNASCHAEFVISTVTGETVLTLTVPDVTMRYVGWLGDRRMGDPKFRRTN